MRMKNVENYIEVVLCKQGNKMSIQKWCFCDFSNKNWCFRDFSQKRKRPIPRGLNRIRGLSALNPHVSAVSCKISLEYIREHVNC